jgi:hypothetical protein
MTQRLACGTCFASRRFPCPEVIAAACEKRDIHYGRQMRSLIISSRDFCQQNNSSKLTPTLGSRILSGPNDNGILSEQRERNWEKLPDFLLLLHYRWAGKGEIQSHPWFWACPEATPTREAEWRRRCQTRNGIDKHFPPRQC